MRHRLKAALAAGVAAAILFAAGVAAQEPAAPEAAPSPAAEAVPAKPKPKLRPKPKPKPVPKPAPEGEANAPTAAIPGPSTVETPPLRTRRDEANHTAEPPSPPVSEIPGGTPSQGAFAAPLVACDPGQAVLYDGPKGFSLWLTRTGSVTIDNPLRPLTPDVTRVVQLVIGDKLATAYGRDLTALRRGASPAALESLLGGPIRWDAALGSLPDGFDIVSDSGAPLAQMRFKECGTAPVAKAPPAPVARKDGKSRPSRKAPASDAPMPAALARSPASQGAAAPGAPVRPATPQRQFNLPQGAIGQ